MPATISASKRVVIAVDPHKASWTAAAVDQSLRPLATVRVAVNRTGYRHLCRFARRWPQATWAIEGATGLGAPLTARLAADGVAVTDVPAKLAARVRLLSTGHGRKSDDADAISVGIAALGATGLQTVAIDEAITALRAMVEHRGDLVKIRTQTINRLHVLLARLIPGGGPTRLAAESAAHLLRTVRPASTAGKALRRLAAELIAEVRRLDRRIAVANTEITAMVAESGSTLTELCGIGPLQAGKILAHVGAIGRFRSAAAFASFNGTAPIEVSSGEVVRHRLSRAGDRQLNHALHIMAITQITRDTPGRAYYQRKRAEGKSGKEALRCLKRRLSDVVYRQLVRDACGRQTGPGGQLGATVASGAAGLTPKAGSLDKSRPGPAETDPTT